MKKLSLIATIAICIYSLESCKKDSTGGSTNNTVTKPKTQLLTANTWRYKAQFFGIANQKLDDFSSTMDACWWDNTLVFNSNGTFVLNEGADRCTGEPASYSGSWVLSSDQTKLTTTSTHDTTQYTIRLLDDSNMELSSFDNSGSIPWEAKDVYIKK
jgi:hypothetical protein